MSRAIRSRLGVILGAASIAAVNGCQLPDPEISAKLWDVETGAELQVFRAGGTVTYTAAFAPDGMKLLTGYPHSPILWDINTGTRLHTFDPVTHCPQGGDSGKSASMVAFSPGGKQVLASNWGGATLWNLSSGEETWSFCKHDLETTTFVGFSPEGTRVLIGRGYRGSVWLDATTGHEIKSINVFLVPGALSPDGTKLLSGGRSAGTPMSPLPGTGAGTATMFDAETGTELRTFSAQPTGRPIASVGFSQDGSKILTASFDGTARIWDAQTGNVIQTFRDPCGSITTASISPNGTKVLTGSIFSSTIGLWDTATGKLIRNYPSGRGAAGLVFSSDGARFVALGYGRWYGN